MDIVLFYIKSKDELSGLTVIFATDSVAADPMLTIWTMGDMLE